MHQATPVNGHGIQLSTSGRLIIPVYLRNGSDAGSFSGVIYSDNHGRWQCIVFSPASWVYEGGDFHHVRIEEGETQSLCGLLEKHRTKLGG